MAEIQYHHHFRDADYRSFRRARNCPELILGVWSECCNAGHQVSLWMPVLRTIWIFFVAITITILITINIVTTTTMVSVIVIVTRRVMRIFVILHFQPSLSLCGALGDLNLRVNMLKCDLVGHSNHPR